MTIGIIRYQTINCPHGFLLHGRVHHHQRVLHGSTCFLVSTHERKSQHHQHLIPLRHHHRFKNILFHASGYFSFDILNLFSFDRFFHGYAFYMDWNRIQNNDIRTSIYVQNPFVHVSQRLLHFETTVCHDSGIQYLIFLVAQILF